MAQRTWGTSDNLHRPTDGKSQGDVYLLHDRNQERMAETIEKLADRLLQLETLVAEIAKRGGVDVIARQMLSTLGPDVTQLTQDLEALSNAYADHTHDVAGVTAGGDTVTTGAPS